MKTNHTNPSDNAMLSVRSRTLHVLRSAIFNLPSFVPPPLPALRSLYAFPLSVFRFLLSTFCFLLSLAPASAATRYVWQESPSPAPPYTTWATAATVIQDAVHANTSGKSIEPVVAPTVKASSGVGISVPMLNFEEFFSYSSNGYRFDNNVSVADVDGNGRQDVLLLLTADTPDRSLWQAIAILLLAGSDGTYTESIITNFPGSVGYGALIEELNGDGAQDVILSEGMATHVLLNKGPEGFQEVWSGPGGYGSLTTVDVNVDGFLDLVVGTQTGQGGLIELFTNNGNGTAFTKTWQSPLYGAGFGTIHTVSTASLNGDDAIDLVAREIYAGLLITLLGTRGSNGFAEHTVLPFGQRTFALTTGNVDGDALTDLAVHVGWGQVRILVSEGDGSVAEYWRSSNLGQAAFNLALSDFDQDGLDDLFVGTFGDGRLRVYRNMALGQFELAWSSQVPGEGYTGTVCDLDGDAYPDLIVGERNQIRLLRNVPPNAPPIADASATRPFWISPNSLNANVVLDGSRSSDPDGDPLTYLWLSAFNSQPSTALATGVVAAVPLAVGAHTIDLVVDDGLARDTNTVTVTVLTTERAVARLIGLVSGADLQHKQPLLATLNAALASIQRGNCHSAVGQLHAFQNKVGAQVTDAVLAMELIAAAGQAITALDCDGSTHAAPRIRSLKRHANGRTQLQIEGTAGQVYLIEASTNLVDWEAVGTATVQGDGSFQFEDTDAAHQACRYYRAAVP